MEEIDKQPVIEPETMDRPEEGEQVEVVEPEVIPEPVPDPWDGIDWHTDDAEPVDAYYVKDGTFNHLTVLINPATHFVAKEVADYHAGAWFLLSDAQWAFHKVNMEASVLEVINMKLNEPEVVPEPVRTLEQAISEKLAAIDAYDNSEAVNSFFVNGYPTWIDAATRSTYLTSIQMAAIRKKETIVIPILSTYPELPLDHATGMLAQIQGQADDSAITTMKHKDAVKAFTTKEGVTVEEVDSYDNTTGYPEKASFFIQI